MSRKFSLVRAGLVAALISLLATGALILALYADWSSHRAPLDVPPYPGAAMAGQSEDSATSLRLLQP